MRFLHGIPAAVFGMNRRNHDLVLQSNPAKAIALANDKIGTKNALAARGVPVPASIVEVRAHWDVRSTIPMLLSCEHGFVAKPSHGS